METIPLVITVGLMLAATFGFIFWFARAATKNNHKQIRLLAEHFNLQLHESSSFWVMPKLTGELNGLSLTIEVQVSKKSEGYELTAIFTVPKQHFNFRIQRKTRLGYTKNQAELMDARIDEHFIIKTNEPAPVTSFLQDIDTIKVLDIFKEHFLIGTQIVLQDNQMGYVMAFAGVGENKRQKIIKAIEVTRFLAEKLHKGKL